MSTNFWELLQQHQGDLTKSGRTVAEYLVQHAAEAQYLSISSLARECQVAEATVFRFCRALGFEGYHEMRIALAQANATGVLVNQQEPAPDADTATLCEHASEREVIAAEAERAASKYKRVEFMQARLGEEFAGHISGITEWGIFVEIDENHIEGLVAMRDMHDDFYDFDPAEYTVTGRSTGRRFTLGDAVRIRVKRADLQKRQLDFDMVLPDAPRTDTPQRGRRSPQVKRRR